jgi:hypothetical protein
MHSAAVAAAALKGGLRTSCQETDLRGFLDKVVAQKPFARAGHLCTQPFTGGTEIAICWAWSYAH